MYRGLTPALLRHQIWIFMMKKMVTVMIMMMMMMMMKPLIVVTVLLPDIYNLVRIFPSNASLFLAYETTKKFLAEEKLDK